MEVLLVMGEGRDVKKVAEKIMTLRGVKHVKLTTIIPGEEI
jgi:CopG family nickel-responsive transcriptional regulator